MAAARTDPVIYDGLGRWDGCFTLENAEAVTEAIRDMLDGRRYTWVAVNEGLDPLHPEVRASEYLDAKGNREGEAITLHRGSYEHSGEPYAHLIAGTSYGVWGISTRHPDQRAAREDDRHATYVSLKREREVRIRQRVPAGHRVTWVMAVEEER